MILSPFSRVFASIVFILMTTNTSAQSRELSVEVQRIKKIQGQLHYQLFSCPKNELLAWDELNLLVTDKVEIVKDKVKFSFSGLEPDRYLIRIFQDINDNSTLDFSHNGVPKEPTGFSNNPNLLLGYPKPIDTCFTYDVSDSVNYSADNPVIIKLNNKKKRKRRKVR